MTHGTDRRDGFPILSVRIRLHLAILRCLAI